LIEREWKNPFRTSYGFLHTASMPKVTFIIKGQEKVVDAEPGQTVLEIAQKNEVPMESACGGNGFCMTCKCHVRKGGDQVSKPNEREEAMGITGEERLGCQTKVNGDVTVELE